MNSQHLNKVVLKNTTKMSLNDRFSAYRKNAESNVGAMRQRMQQVQQQTSKNWRLIQQMENRPSVIAALKLKKNDGHPERFPFTQRSLKQRLGQTAAPATAAAAPRQSVKARLSLGSTNGARGGIMQRYRGGGYSAGFVGGAGAVAAGGPYRMSSRRGAASRSRGGGRVGQIGRPLAQSYSGVSPRGRGSQWSLNGGGAVAAIPLQNRLGTTRGRAAALRRPRRGNRTVGEDTGEFHRGRGGAFRSPQGRFRGQGNKFRTSSQTRGTAGVRGARGAVRLRGRGRGRGRGARGQQTVTPSRQTLDNQLDEYMSRTKGNLDMELDSYMAQSQAE